MKNALIDLGENPKVNLLSAISIDNPWYGGIRRDSRHYTIFDGILYRQGIDGVLRRAIDAEEASKVVK